MTDLLFELVENTARVRPDAEAIVYKDERLNYRSFAEKIDHVSCGLLLHGLARGERVAIYLEKRLETAIGIFAASAAGGAFVPINPLLKPRQVGHILRDCQVRVLISSTDRLAMLAEEIAQSHDLRTIVNVDASTPDLPREGITATDWASLLADGERSSHRRHRVIESDMTAILYTSGSTGRPKGVVLSHHNMVVGAKSVSSYLENTPDDRILAALPFSFDAGLSQITTAAHVGASLVLMNFLLPQDVIKAVAREKITGLAAVPPLWVQLADQKWPEEAVTSLRYWTNTGGAMPAATLEKLRIALPKTSPVLMYGLTEAFRSSYLPPSELDKRPGSMGKAIPNAEILVVRENGELCAPGEPGELVHRGPLVSMGYWNDPDRTAERFKPSPVQQEGLTIPEIAVWSGDTVKMDEDGFLYFVGRRDEMIKTSGYRVSPTEVEEILYASGLVGEAVALGIPHPKLGQGIVIVATDPADAELNEAELLDRCRKDLPAFMVPHKFVRRDGLPRNPNGKIDRKSLSQELADLFESSKT